MNLDFIRDIDFSKKDLLRNIRLPNKLTPELAELMGIIVGDGHIDYKKYKSTTAYSIYIAGSCSEDFDYYNNKINPLFLKLFNVKFSLTSRRKDELIIRIYSKAIATFFRDLGIKTAKKVDDSKIPNIILQSNDDIKKGFLRGIFDTEFSVMFKKDTKGKHSRPIISTRMKSQNIIFQLKELLENFGFSIIMYKDRYFDKRSNKFNLGYKLELAGKKNLKKYIELIKFRNPKHLTKIEIWKKFGFCPPKRTYKERLDILKGNLDPNSFYI